MATAFFLINAKSELKESWQRFVSQHARWSQELQQTETRPEWTIYRNMDGIWDLLTFR